MDKIKIRPSKVGSLHSALGVKPNALVPKNTISKALAGSPSPEMEKKLVFAQNAAHWNK